MGLTRAKSSHPDGISEEAEGEVPKAVKQEMLKHMMREREEISQRLVKLDYWIWVLEEFFRAGGP